jgi:hypothetical protein
VDLLADDRKHQRQSEHIPKHWSYVAFCELLMIFASHDAHCWRDSPRYLSGYNRKEEIDKIF